MSAVTPSSSKKRQLCQVIEPAEEAKKQAVKMPLRRTAVIVAATKSTNMFTLVKSNVQSLDMVVMNSAPAHHRMRSQSSGSSNDGEDILLPNFEMQPSEPLSMSLTSQQSVKRLTNGQSRALRF